MVPPTELIDVDGLRLLELRMGGVVVRLTDTAEYVVDLSDPDDDRSITVVLEQGLLWAAIDAGDSGPALQVRHDTATLRMTSATMLLDAGAVGDGLVVVVDGEVDVTVPGGGTTWRLSANEAAALRPSEEAIEVLGITSTEVEADPWVSANLRLDEHRPPDPDPVPAAGPVEATDLRVDEVEAIDPAVDDLGPDAVGDQRRVGQ